MNESTEITTDNCVLDANDLVRIDMIFTDYANKHIKPNQVGNNGMPFYVHNLFQKITKLNDWYEGTHLKKIKNEFCEPEFEEVTESE